MNAVSVAPTHMVEHASPVGQPMLLERFPGVSAAEAAAEVNRWAIFLGVPFLLASIFFMAAMVTGKEWPIAGSLITGPGLLIGVIIYLSLSTDTNGAQ
jgi:hypothetical protein